jgi:hypothetical protein
MKMTSFVCLNCGKYFPTTLSRVEVRKRANLKGPTFCNQTCAGEYKTIKKINTQCATCDTHLLIYPRNYNNSKTKRFYCNSSCSAKYNNAHKTHGTNRSKLEVWLETKLTDLYPKLEIHYNRKDAILSELDFYLPSLKLAFELNGIFHYEPIYGPELLERTQNNDNRKFQACLERGIEFCTIDSSKQKRFTEKSSQPYLDIICNIINQKTASLGIEPSSFA